MIVTKGNELKKYMQGKTVVALGSFDAIHRGHIAIISAAVAFAKTHNLSAVVQIFTVPPGVKMGAPAINTLDERIAILEELGVDAVAAEEFDSEFRHTSAGDFVKKHLCEKYNVSAVFAGDNYRFGYMAEGDSEELSKLCSQAGIDAHIIKCVEDNGVISSTRIRNCIQEGRVAEAAELMSRLFFVSGRVIHGRKVGRTLDFPTANISLPQGRLLPKDGVYKTLVVIENKEYHGITNVGAKPTVEIDERTIETHIIGINQDIYGKEIHIGFVKRIRDIKKFNSLEELRTQLQKDKIKA